MEIFIIVVLVAVVIFITLKPYELKWSCVFGRHNFHKIGLKYGMYLNKDTNKIVGTTRQLYQCQCGKIKAAAAEDWVGGVK